MFLPASLVRRLSGAVLGLSLIAAALGPQAGPARAANAAPSFAPPEAIVGPSSDVLSLGGVSVARDGTGGLVYLRSVAGVAHLFVSRLVAGDFAPPEQLDAALPGAASSPVIAAGDGGVLLVAFSSGGSLYVLSRGSATSPWQGPQLLIQGGGDPALAMSTHGKGYLAFTVPGPAALEVHAAYWVGGTWALAGGALNAALGTDAGSGNGRPAVAAAGDGVGIVAWGESGHIYTRRVWATQPSTAVEQADPPSVGGAGEIATDGPRIAVADDSSYAAVVFRETVSSGGARQVRELLSRLRASSYDIVGAPVDRGPTPLAPGDASAGIDARPVLSPVSRGFVTFTGSGPVLSENLGVGGGPANPLAPIAAGPGCDAPYAAPAITGLYSGLIAWPSAACSGGPVELHARFYDGTAFGPEQIASSPIFGSVDGSLGLSAAGDGSGNVAVAWVQANPAGRTLVAGRLFYPPGAFSAVPAPRYTRTSQPTFAWTAAREQWGPLTYSVVVDGRTVLSTGGQSARMPGPLPDGPHLWQVTATNELGQSFVAGAQTVWVDTVAPVAQLGLTGAEQPGRGLRLLVRFSDAPAPEPAAAASGVAAIKLDWGDGTRLSVRNGARHTYAFAGTYRITVSITDRAGNATKLTRRVAVTVHR